MLVIFKQTRCLSHKTTIGSDWLSPRENNSIIFSCNHKTQFTWKYCKKKFQFGRRFQDFLSRQVDISSPISCFSPLEGWFRQQSLFRLVSMICDQRWSCRYLEKGDGGSRNSHKQAKQDIYSLKRIKNAVPTQCEPMYFTLSGARTGRRSL